MCFRSYGLRNKWLEKFRNRAVSQDPLTGNVVNGPKNSFNLNDSTLSILIDHCEESSVEKSLF